MRESLTLVAAMSDECVETTLGEVADFTNGFPFKPADLHGTTLPVIRIKQLLDEQAETDFTDLEVPARNLIHNGDLIFSWSGTLASRFWNRGPAALNQHLFRVTAKRGSDLGWVHLALDHAVEDLSTKTHGTTMKHVTKKVLESHEVIRPPLPVQRRIVDLMTHLDSHLANLRAEKGAAEDAARLLVEERLSGAEDGAEWPRVDIASVCSLVTDGSHSSPKTVDDGYPYVTVRDIRDSRIHFDSAARVTTEDFNLLKRTGCAPQQGDVLFAKDGATMGKVALVPDARDFVVLSSLAILRPDTSQVLPEYLFFALGSPSFYQSALESRTGLAITRIVLKTLKSLSIPLPDLRHQLSIVDEVSALYSAIESLQREVEALATLRSTLLGQLLTGNKMIQAAYDQLLTEAA